MIRNFLLFALRLLTVAISTDAIASSVSAVSVPLAKVVSDSRLIVVAAVEQVTIVQPEERTKNDPGLRYFQVRIEEVLKAPDSTARRNLKGRTIAIFDPMEIFYHDRADLIAAGVISFVDPRYATRVQSVVAGERLVFFLGDKQPRLPHPEAYVLIGGRAYDRLGIKPAVLKRLN